MVAGDGVPHEFRSATPVLHALVDEENCPAVGGLVALQEPDVGAAEATLVVSFELAAGFFDGNRIGRIADLYNPLPFCSVFFANNLAADEKHLPQTAAAPKRSKITIRPTPGTCCQ